MYHGFIPPTKENLTSEHLFDASQLQTEEDIPASLDLREKGYVTEVKTQVRPPSYIPYSRKFLQGSIFVGGQSLLLRGFKFRGHEHSRHYVLYN